MSKLHIVFDGPPGPVSGRFVECEDEHGKGISIGKWVQVGDCWHLIMDHPSQVRGDALEEVLALFTKGSPEKLPPPSNSTEAGFVAGYDTCFRDAHDRILALTKGDGS